MDKKYSYFIAYAQRNLDNDKMALEACVVNNMIIKSQSCIDYLEHTLEARFKGNEGATAPKYELKVQSFSKFDSLKMDKQYSYFITYSQRNLDNDDFTVETCVVNNFIIKSQSCIEHLEHTLEARFKVNEGATAPKYELKVLSFTKFDSLKMDKKYSYFITFTVKNLDNELLAVETCVVNNFIIKSQSCIEHLEHIMEARFKGNEGATAPKYKLKVQSFSKFDE